MNEMLGSDCNEMLIEDVYLFTVIFGREENERNIRCNTFNERFIVWMYK